MDRTTELLSSYACNLTYEDLPPTVVHQVKRTVADTLGCAIGGYLSEPGQDCPTAGWRSYQRDAVPDFGHLRLLVAGYGWFRKRGNGAVSGLQRLLLLAGRRSSQ